VKPGMVAGFDPIACTRKIMSLALLITTLEFL
jgi:hypothetical protein